MLSFTPRYYLNDCPTLSFLKYFQRVYEKNRDETADEVLRYYFRWFDQMQQRKEEIFTKLGYKDVHNLADKIKSNVLFGYSLMDDVCPPSTQKAVYNHLQCIK